MIAYPPSYSIMSFIVMLICIIIGISISVSKIVKRIKDKSISCWSIISPLMYMAVIFFASIVIIAVLNVCFNWSLQLYIDILIAVSPISLVIGLSLYFSRTHLSTTAKTKSMSLNAPDPAPLSSSITSDISKIPPPRSVVKVKAKKVFAAASNAESDHPVAQETAVIENRFTHSSKLPIVLIILLTICLIISSYYAYYQSSQVKHLNQQLTEIQQNLTFVQSERARFYNEAKQNDSLYRAAKSDYSNLSHFFERVKSFYFVPIKEWTLYKNMVACVTSPYGNTAYHLPSCSHLGDSCYILGVNDALKKGCWPCSDCYSINFYHGGPKDTYDNILFKQFFE